MKSKDKKSKFGFLKTRKFRYGSIATAVTVCVIAFVILLNVVLNVLGDSINLSFDMTLNNFYGMSQETKDYIAGIDKDIEIIVVAKEDDFENTDGEYYVQANSIIKQYAQNSGKITVKYLDLDSNPNLSKQYSKESLQANDVIVRTSESYKILTSDDLFEGSYNYYSYSYSITSSKAEQAITSAILSLTSDQKTKVEFITGFEEDDYSSLQGLLEDNNYKVSETKILTEDLSLDTSIVFIYAPIRDYDKEAVQKLNKFMKSGKAENKSVVYIANPNASDTPVLNSFLEKWGLTVDSGMAFETDTNYLFSTQSAFFTVAQYGDSDYTSSLKDTSIPVAMPYCSPITVNKKKSLTQTKLLTLSESSGICPDDADENWEPSDDDLVGSVTVAALSTKTKKSKTSNVCVIGSSYAFDESLLERSSTNNSAYFTNLFNGLSATDSGIVIESKSVQYDTFNVTVFQAVAIGVTLILVIPILLIIIGIVVWLRRRHK